MNLTPFYIDDVIHSALEEDINYLDVTTDYLIDENSRSEAVLLAKSEGVLCGIGIAKRVFELLDPTFTAELFAKDGDRLAKGQKIAVFSGKTRELLHGERTALNLMQHMSGIATSTARAVEIIKGTNATIADTRKTLPGLRPLQKYAVTVGGGKNHRYGLSDAVLIKDNHIDACGSITSAVEAIRSKVGHMVKIEVETRNLDEVREALDTRADVIMLDNMTCGQMKEAVSLIGGRAAAEASGNVTEETLRKVAETGVDIISMGVLTHSVKALDISMKIRLGKAGQ